ncbi:MAG TPA: MEKHLA domain-containing protein [Nitrospira sp.]
MLPTAAYGNLIVIDAVWMTPRVLLWSRWLLDSYCYWTGRELIEREGGLESQAGRLFGTAIVVVSHGTEGDPLLNYGNQAALDLWETTWEQFVTTPSRLTAPAADRDERQRMLESADARGFFDAYRGVRVTMSGRRFLIENAQVWTVLDTGGARVGQAATFSHWTWL